MSDSGDTECPTCGRDDFKNQRGMKQHHARTHGESLRESSECDYCGSEFKHERDSSQPHRFCSKQCHWGHQSENPKTGSEAHNWEGGKVEMECSYCGGSFEVKPYREKTASYCSCSCRASDTTGEDHPRYDKSAKREINCYWCGDTAQREPWEIESGKRMFCDRACETEWKRSEDHPTGEECCRYQGGYQPYGPGWNERKKRRVRIRDQARCQNCGMTEPECLKEFGRVLDVHHIQPARSFENPGPRNAMENLISLCVGCHKEWEKMAPLRPATAD